MYIVQWAPFYDDDDDSFIRRIPPAAIARLKLMHRLCNLYAQGCHYSQLRMFEDAYLTVRANFSRIQIGDIEYDLGRLLAYIDAQMNAATILWESVNLPSTARSIS